jgi:alpha-mannosidase
MLYGKYTYEFAIYPFIGGWQEADIHRKSLEYNFPVPQVAVNFGNGSLGDKLALLDMKANNVILSALYPSNGGIYSRFYEFAGVGDNPEINWKIKTANITEVNFLGEKVEKRYLEFKPWEIKTYFIRP